MSRFLKFSFLLLSIFAAVWLAALWQWHERGADPSATELAVYLVALPLALTAVCALGAWQLQKIRAFMAAPLVSASLEAPTAPADAQAGALPLSRAMLVLAADVQSRIGPAWAAALAGTVAGEHAPQLHARLVDGQGHPAFVAEWQDIRVTEVAAAWEVFAAAQAHAAAMGEHPVDDPPDDILRTLTLVNRCLLNLQPSLHAQWAVLAPDTLGAAQGRHARTAATLPRVRIEIGLPARWPERWRTAVSAWLHQEITPLMHEGMKAAGQSAAMASTPQAVVQCRVHAVESAGDFWEALDQRHQRWLSGDVPGLMLVIAADSALNQAHLSRLDAQRSLLTLKQANGRLPGEGGAALLLATPAWVASQAYAARALSEPLARLDPPQFVGKSEAVALPVKDAGTASLHQSVMAALQSAGMTPAQVGSVTSDTDHRAAWQAGLFDVMAQHFPHLAPDEHALCAGVGCGDAGIALWLMCVAWGVERVQATQQPGLVMSHAEPERRLALVLHPARSQEALAAG